MSKRDWRGARGIAPLDFCRFPVAQSMSAGGLAPRLPCRGRTGPDGGAAVLRGKELRSLPVSAGRRSMELPGGDLTSIVTGNTLDAIQVHFV